MHVEGVWAVYLGRPTRNGGPPRQAWMRQSGFRSTACLQANTGLRAGRGRKALVLGHPTPRHVVQQKRAVRTTTLPCLLTACTNPALIAQGHLTVLQGSADAEMVHVGASYCRQDGARATRVAPLWVARCPSPTLPAMLHAACGVLLSYANRLEQAGRTVRASAWLQISALADLASVPPLPVPQPATKCMGSTLRYHWSLGDQQLLEGPAKREGNLLPVKRSTLSCTSPHAPPSPPLVSKVHLDVKEGSEKTAVESVEGAGRKLPLTDPC